MASKPSSTSRLISGLAASEAGRRRMPDASANSEKTPSVASTARKPRMYGSALLRPSTTMPVAAPTRMPATSSTKTTLPPRCVLAVRSTAGRTVAALTVTSVAPGVLIRVPSYRESRRFHRPHGAGRLKCGAPGDRLTQGASLSATAVTTSIILPRPWPRPSLRVRPVAGFGNGLHRVLEHHAEVRGRRLWRPWRRPRTVRSFAPERHRPSPRRRAWA